MPPNHVHEVLFAATARIQFERDRLVARGPGVSNDMLCGWADLDHVEARFAQIRLALSGNVRPWPFEQVGDHQILPGDIALGEQVVVVDEARVDFGAKSRQKKRGVPLRLCCNRFTGFQNLIDSFPLVSKGGLMRHKTFSMRPL